MALANLGNDDVSADVQTRRLQWFLKVYGWDDVRALVYAMIDRQLEQAQHFRTQNNLDGMAWAERCKSWTKTAFSQIGGTRVNTNTSGTESDMMDLIVARAPIIRFDNKEPFFPVKVGYTIFNETRQSPSFPREISLQVSEGQRATSAIEYAIYWDWDIGHLYELEHIWVYMDQGHRPICLEASWHGGYHRFAAAEPGATLPTPLVVYSQPGKHAFAPSPSWFEPHDKFAESCTVKAGNAGLLVTSLFQGIIEKKPGDDEFATEYLKRFAFQPSFQFERDWVVTKDLLMPWEELNEWIPRRIDEILEAKS